MKSNEEINGKAYCPEEVANSTTNEISLSKPKGNVRWFMCFLLLMGGIINYLDRANLSIAAPAMMRDLNLTNTDIGLMGSVFSLAYAFMQLPAGWLVDRISAKKMYAGAVTLWSAATAFTGLCSTMPAFIVGRVALGVFEAPCMPIAAKITSHWFPRKERGMASGIFDAASKVGPAIAAPILVTLLVMYDWRALFLITGGVGIVFAILFLLAYTNPDDNKFISKSEFDYIAAGGGGLEKKKQVTSIKWSSLFKYRSIWGMILGYFCIVWLFNIFLVFLPLYLVKTQNIVFNQLGIWASIPWIGGIFGDIIGGYMSGKLVDVNHMEPMKAKRFVMSISALLAGAVTIAIPFATDIKVTVLLMAIAIACISSITGNAWALASDVAPKSMVASVGSIQNFGGYFGGALSPLVVGFIADITGSFALAFISGGIIAAGAALCYWIIVKSPITAEERTI
jgi:ACS family D-galactonate transporter-like MFS transporter